MPPSIDGDASPHSPPTLTAGPDRVGTSREAVSAAEIAATQRRNDRITHNFNATVQMFEYLSRCIFETNELRDYQNQNTCISFDSTKCLDLSSFNSTPLILQRAAKTTGNMTCASSMNSTIFSFDTIGSLYS